MLDREQVRASMNADPGRLIAALGLREDKTKERPDQRWCFDNGETDASLKINTSGQFVGTWKRHGGDGRGGDFFALIARVRGLHLPDEFRQVLRIAADIYGIADSQKKTSTRVTEYVIRNSSGKPVAIHCREDKADGKKSFYWKQPLTGELGLRGVPVAEIPLYGTELLILAKPDDVVWIVEGEKSAIALIERGLLALGTACGASVTPTEEVLTPLLGREVLLWPDNDVAGERHMLSVAMTLERVGVAAKIVVVPQGLPKGWDAADWVSDRKETSLDDLVAAAVPWRDAAIPLGVEGDPFAEPDEDLAVPPVDNVEDFLRSYRTEASVAYAYRDSYGDRMRYADGRWNVYKPSEGRWSEDSLGVPMLWAMELARARIGAATSLESSEEREEEIKFAFSCEREPVLRHILTMAQSLPPIPARSTDFDSDPWALCVGNGVLLLKTRELVPHGPDWLHRKRTPVVYDPDAECPQWLKFLDRVQPDLEIRSFLQRYIGYSLTGSVDEEVCVIAYGGGKNGKTVFCFAVDALLGDYSCTAPTSILLPNQRPDSGPRDELMRLMGRRITFVNELPQGSRLNENAVKQLVATDIMVARTLFCPLVEFKPTHKLFIRTNHMPVIRDPSEGIWRRIALVQWDQYITPEERVPQTEMLERFVGEMSGILNWALEGLDAWQAMGLAHPCSVTDATASYRKREDRMGLFLEDRCDENPDVSVSEKELFRAYSSWCEDAGERRPTSERLGRALTERGFRQGRRGAERRWQGIALKTESEADIEGIWEDS
jgi:putative DNA primase/helicase